MEKQAEEALNGQLKRRAAALTSDEAVDLMELVQELQDIAVVKETITSLAADLILVYRLAISNFRLLDM
jgi:hypothetical protein